MPLNKTPAEDLANLREEYIRACRELAKRKRAMEKTQPVNPVIRVPPASDAGQFRSTHDFSAVKANHLSKHKYLEVETEPGYSTMVSVEALVTALHKNGIVAQEILEELKLFETQVAGKSSRQD